MQRARRNAGHEDAVWIAAVFGNVVAQITDRGRDVARAFGPLRLRRQAIAPVDADVAQAREVLGDVGSRSAVAADEPTAVEDDDRRNGLCRPTHARVKVDVL